MLLFFVILWFARFVILAAVLFQFVSMLVSGKINERLLELGESLGLYSYQIIRFLTYNTEEKPFPFAEWPE
jgi:hypothetical protein